MPLERCDSAAAASSSEDPEFRPGMAAAPGQRPVRARSVIVQLSFEFLELVLLEHRAAERHQRRHRRLVDPQLVVQLQRPVEGEDGHVGVAEPGSTFCRRGDGRRGRTSDGGNAAAASLHAARAR